MAGAALRADVPMQPLLQSEPVLLLQSEAVTDTSNTDSEPTPSLRQPEATSSPTRRFISPTGHGRIIYLGVDSAGLLGLIDASECTPTYGSKFNDVRGFVSGGWTAIGGVSGPAGVVLHMPTHLRGDAGTATASAAEEVRLDVSSFIADVIPTIVPADLVVFLAIECSEEEAHRQYLAEAVNALARAASAGAAVAHVIVTGAHGATEQGGIAPHTAADTALPTSAALLARAKAVAPLGVTLRLPSVRVSWDLRMSSRAPSDAAAMDARVSPFIATAPPSLGQYALKLAINAITTGAHIARGAIVSNRMVAVAITNQKLFHRAVRLIGDVTGISPQGAERSILRAIYTHNEDDEAHAGGRFAATSTPLSPHDHSVRRSSSSRSSLTQLAALPASAHVAAASAQTGLVPIAILLALDEVRRGEAPEGSGSSRRLTGHGSVPRAPLTVAQAAARLKEEPIVRRAMGMGLQ